LPYCDDSRKLNQVYDLEEEANVVYIGISPKAIAFVFNIRDPESGIHLSDLQKIFNREGLLLLLTLLNEFKMTLIFLRKFPIQEKSNLKKALRGEKTIRTKI
jgi:hypothetical protein